MNKIDFNQLCKSHGFKRIGPSNYARCIGDGIYQTIYTGGRQYIDPESPHYTTAHRKSNYLSIGVWSMYSNRMEDDFKPGIMPGWYSPHDLSLDANPDKRFHGIEAEYQMMADYGFIRLDQINSQEEMLKLYMHTQTGKGGEHIHTLELVEPFLLVGKKQEAMFEVSHYCMHSLARFMRDSNVAYLTDRVSEQTELWVALLTDNRNIIQSRITHNFQQNSRWALENQIPFLLDYHERKLATDT